MRVKGTAYLARVQLLKAKLGSDEAVEEFLARYQRSHPEFPKSVIPTTQIPAHTFLAFVDAVVDEVYGGERDSLWDIGRRSAEWALTAGPYKSLLEFKDVERFAAMASVMWSNYFDKGSARSEIYDDRIELWIEDVPEDVRHPYFEFSVVGYFQRGLELLGAEVRREAVESFVSGGERVHYRLITAR